MMCPIFTHITDCTVINRPEVRKLLLFYFFFFSTWSWKIIPYLLFLLFLDLKLENYSVFTFLLFLDLNLENYSTLTFLLFLDLKLENYSIFRWRKQDCSNSSLCWPPHEWKPGAPPGSDVSASERVHVMGQTDNSILNIFPYLLHIPIDWNWHTRKTIISLKR